MSIPTLLNRFINPYLVNEVMDYHYHDYKPQYNEVITQINEYSFGIQNLPLLVHTKVRHFGCPHMLYSCFRAFYKLLRNPDYNTVLTDINAFDDDQIFNADTCEEVIDELIWAIGGEFGQETHMFYYVDFDPDLL